MHPYEAVPARAQAYLDAFQVAGLPASMDLAALNSPGLLLRAPSASGRFDARSISLDWSAVLVGPGLERSQALAVLAPLVGLAATVVRSLQAIGPVDVITPTGNTLPGLEIVWQTKLTAVEP